jgi:hypothetical protein
LKVYGLKGIELVSPIDVSVSSKFKGSDSGSNLEEGREGGNGSEDEEVSPQIILQWKSPPRLRLYFGSRAIISTTSERLKVKRLNHDSVELYRPTITVPSPSSMPSVLSPSPKSKAIYGELPLDMDDSRAFWNAFRHHSKHLINSETGFGEEDTSGQLSILQILGGKAEAVLGFWISLRVSEWEEGEGHKMSPTEVRASGLTPIYSRWKGLALAIPKDRQHFPRATRSSSDGLVSSWWTERGRKSREDKYDWKQVVTLVKYPEMIPKITLEPWLLEQMKKNDTLTSQLQELQSLLGTSHLVVGVEDRPPA